MEEKRAKVYKLRKIIEDILMDNIISDKYDMGFMIDDAMHVSTVSHLMYVLGLRRGLDPDISEVIGLLHDIGRIKNLDLSKTHGVTGANYLMHSMSDYYDCEIEVKSLIVSSISNHSDKKSIHDPYSELLKDCDVFHRFLTGEYVSGKKHKDIRIKRVRKELMIETDHSITELDMDRIIASHYVSDLFSNELQKVYVMIYSLGESFDIEELIHDIRVIIRNLKSVTYFLKPVIRGQKYKRLRDDFSMISDRVGYCRELSVLLDLLIRYNKASGDEQCLGAIDGVREELKKETLKVKDHKSISKMLRVVDEISYESESLLSKGKYRSHGMKFEEYKIKRFKEIKDEVLELIEVGEFDNEDIHKIRIRFKKLRYTCKYFLAESSGKEQYIEMLKSVQDISGSIHDNMVNLGLLKERFIKDKELRKRIRKFAATENKKSKNALIETLNKWAQIQDIL